MPGTPFPDPDEAEFLMDGTGFDPTGVKRVLSRVDDDPAVEAELSRPPARPPEDEDEWIEWARSKLGPAEAAGAE